MENNESSYLFTEDEKSNLFEKIIEEIERKNIDFFKYRAAQFKEDPHDKLKWYCVISAVNGKIGLGFMDEDNPLLESIKDECRSAFNSIYGE